MTGYDVEDSHTSTMLFARAAIMAHQQLWRDVMRTPGYYVKPKKLVVGHIANATSIYKALNCPWEASVQQGNRKTVERIEANKRIRMMCMQFTGIMHCR